MLIQAQKDKVLNQVNHDDRAVHFGFNIGFNAMDFKFKYNTDYYSSPSPGNFDTIGDIYNLSPSILVSIVSNARISEHLDVRFLPGICFGDRKIAFIDNAGLPILDQPQKIQSNFLDFPLLLKYKADRINNFRPYLVSGFNFRYDLAAKRNYDDSKEEYLLLKPTDFYWEIGFGFDSYLQYFKLTTEIRYSIGLTNVLNDLASETAPGISNSLDGLFSRIFLICFYFE